MLVVYSWLRELAPALPDLAALDAADLVTRLVSLGFEVEGVHVVGAGLSGPVRTGRVLGVEELTGFNKAIRYCQLDVGESVPRGIICGAVNFSMDDVVLVALPGSMLPGGVAITARQTYGHTSDGMICSARELGLGSDHTGILVLGPDTPVGVDAQGLLADLVLDVAVTPDRGYAMSLRGLARELAVSYQLDYADPGLAAAWPCEDGYPVRVADPDGCPTYLAMIVDSVDPSAASPTALGLRLGLAGMRAISLPVDASNAVMLELGAPLHAFDADTLTGPVVVRRARAGERLVTLDGVDRELDPGDLLITDDTGPVALAGVMGGLRTEVTAATTTILLEAAHFDPASVARTARRHRLASEASRRFERYVDPAVAPAAALRFAELVGRPGPGPVTVVGAVAAPPAVAMAMDYPDSVAARVHAPGAVATRLREVGCTVREQPQALLVSPPSWRPDLREPADLAEEVLRLEGYDSIPARLPAPRGGRGLTVAQQRRRLVGRTLAGAGLVEVATVPFSAEDPLGLPASDPRRATVRLANPLSEQEAWLRTSLLPGLFAAAVRNVGRGQGDVALFETGTVFLAPSPHARPEVPPPGRRPTAEQLSALDGALPDQPEHLGLLLAGQLDPAGWWGPGRDADWADAIELARGALVCVGARPTVRRSERAPWHPGRCVDVLVDGQVLGQAGELHPRTVAAWELPPRTCAAELDLTRVLPAAAPPPPAPVLSPYPPAAVDVALVLDATVPAGEVAAALREGAGMLLERLSLIDVYTGPPVPAGSRSLAYRLSLRAPDRTLSGEEVTAARDAAVALAGERTGAVLRA